MSECGQTGIFIKSAHILGQILFSEKRMQYRLLDHQLFIV